MRVLLAACVLVSCARTNTTSCAGFVCPAGRLCDEIHRTCVSQDQLDKCKDKPDRTHCVADLTTGQCDQGVCLPGCGDGVLAAGETCDDGNFENHDGCNSICQLEVPGWAEIPGPWLTRSGHSAAFHAGRERLVVFGGSTQASTSTIAGLASDTWERDDAGTWTRIDVPGPSVRRAAAMTYDARRGVIVLFGGQGTATSVLGDTWEYDGTWIQRTPPVSPSPRQLAAMVYDTTRERVVLFGGSDAQLAGNEELWEYDGTTWTQVAMVGSPGRRFSTAAVYDPDRARVVLFSGSVLDAETWELVGGTTWQRAATGGPGGRFGAAMIFDPVTRRSMLFGGDAISFAYNDTWQWDGATWTQITTARTPAPRRFHSLTATTGPSGSRAILVAGSPETSSRPLDDVWTFEAGQWSLARIALTPPARGNLPMAYDPVRGQLVIYGGLLLQNDTWVFDGAQWRNHTTGTTPGFRYNHAVAWDARRKRIVLYGGGAGGGIMPLGDAWQWDGTQWTAIPIPIGERPPRRAHAAMAGDSAGRIVMYGGAADGSPTSAPLLDTWQLEGAAWERIDTPVHPGPVLGPSMTYHPQLDRIVAFDSAGATWTYANRTWELLVPAGSGPSARTYATLAYDDSRGRVVLYGGSAAGDVLADLWELDGTTWIEVPYAGTPPAATFPAVTYHPIMRALVLFGGTAATTFLDQTWAFRYVSTLPDEHCSGGLDEDTDGLADCDDPDCARFGCAN